MNIAVSEQPRFYSLSVHARSTPSLMTEVRWSFTDPSKNQEGMVSFTTMPLSDDCESGCRTS